MMTIFSATHCRLPHCAWVPKVIYSLHSGKVTSSDTQCRDMGGDRRRTHRTLRILLTPAGWLSSKRADIAVTSDAEPTLARKTMQWPNVLTTRTTRYPAYSKGIEQQCTYTCVYTYEYTHMYMYMSMSMCMYMIIYGLYTDSSEILRCTIISPHNIKLESIDGKHNGVVRGEGLLQQAWCFAHLPRCTKNDFGKYPANMRSRHTYLHSIHTVPCELAQGKIGVNCSMLASNVCSE